MDDESSEEEKMKMRTTLGDVLQKKGLTKYHFAVKQLKKKPNTLTPWDKPKFDPKLSSVIKMAKELKCDVNDLFKAEGYNASGRSKSSATKMTKTVRKRKTAK